MNRCQSFVIRGFSAAVLAAVALWPTVSQADDLDRPASAATFTVQSARERFISCGFQPGSLHDSPGGLLAITDPLDEGRADRRVLMVAVYPDLAAAQVGFRRASGNPGNEIPAMGTDRGPRLFDHYGSSVWRGNVALSQSNTLILDHLDYEDVQTGEVRADPNGREATIALDDSLRGRNPAVDLDFVDCLDGLR